MNCKTGPEAGNVGILLIRIENKHIISKISMIVLINEL